MGEVNPKDLVQILEKILVKKQLFTFKERAKLRGVLNRFENADMNNIRQFHNEQSNISRSENIPMEYKRR